jgi:hypothetical protein
MLKLDIISPVIEYISIGQLKKGKKMKAQKSNFVGVVLMSMLFLYVVVLPIAGQTSNTGNANTQNPVVYYSLVPSILLQNIVFSTSGSNNGSTEITSVACEITILRPSIRD